MKKVNKRGFNITLKRPQHHCVVKGPQALGIVNVMPKSYV